MIRRRSLFGLAVLATHSGMTVERFSKTVENRVATARHPRF